MKSRTRRLIEALERKKIDIENRRLIEGTLDNLIDENQGVNQTVKIRFRGDRKQIVDEAIGWLEDWELGFTDENITKALNFILWGDEDAET